jgi:hypothetical protein
MAVEAMNYLVPGRAVAPNMNASMGTMGMPPQGFAPQGGYAPQQGFAPQGGYAPQQGYASQQAPYGQQPQQGFAPQQPAMQGWVCQFCGATNVGGAFCQSCGAQKA